MTIKGQPDLGAGNFTFFVQTSLRIITICLFFTIMYLFYISCYKPKFGQNNPGCFEKEAENKIFQMLTDDARWRTKTDTYVGNIGV